MRLCCIVVAGACAVLPAISADADEGRGDCLGVDFDAAHPVAVVKVLPGASRVYFLKNAMDDAACPAAADACRETAYLIPGDLALAGKSYGAYTCMSYESAESRKVRWTNGWLPSANLTPVKPAPSPRRSEWIGAWLHASGHIDITAGAKDNLDIRGEGFYAAAQNVHTGEIDATAKPSGALLQFADDGNIAFNDPSAECLVRMQRVESLLVVEDNNGCGGVMVTFTGFYRRKR